MTKNITYLLGAGASANCLPVINELPSRLRIFGQDIRNTLIPDSGEITYGTFANQGYNGYAKNLLSEIEWLILEMDSHNTVDTLAKKFYLIENRHNDLIRLKKVLVAYFIYEQSIKEGVIRGTELKELPDKRYDSLIATIIDKRIGKLGLPDNFKIITWNYDMQFEIAYKEYQPLLNLGKIQDLVQAVPSGIAIDKLKSINLNRFCLVRLNGVAQLSPAVDRIGSNSKYGTQNERRIFTLLLTQLVEYYWSLQNHDLLNFTYSWENPQEYSDTLKNKTDILSIAQKIMNTTDILVIIGYSFPLFNRHIDRELFNKCERLKKIYVQDINADSLISIIDSSFPDLQYIKTAGPPYSVSNDSIRSVSTKKPLIKEAVSSVSQFFIPPEADI